MDLEVGAQSALLAALLDASHECIKLLDSEGRIVFVNREGCRSMELSTPGELVGQPLIERWPAEERWKVEDAFERASQGLVTRFTGCRPGPDNETRWWDVTFTPVTSAGAAKVVSIARDMTVEVAERERAAAIGAEMRHRLRNGMTIAAGLVTLEARAQPEHAAFARAVAARFTQLARVQELVLDSDNATSLQAVLPLLANVYGSGSLLRISDLPDVRLGDAETQALALAMGELATNSLKYGALSAGNAIAITAQAAESHLCLEWQEPTTFGEARPGGQGLGLIDRILAAAGGTIVREIADGSLYVRITLPIVSEPDHAANRTT